jgi:hypothetical protein
MDLAHGVRDGFQSHPQGRPPGKVSIQALRSGSQQQHKAKQSCFHGEWILNVLVAAKNKPCHSPFAYLYRNFEKNSDGLEQFF